MKRFLTSIYSMRLGRQLYYDEIEKEYSRAFSNETQRWSNIKWEYTYPGCQASYAETIEEDIKDYGFHFLALDRGCPIIYLKWVLKNKDKILEKEEKEKEEKRKWWQFWKA